MNPQETSSVALSVNPRSVAKLLAFAMMVMTIMGVAATLSKYEFGGYNYFRAYDMYSERTIPTVYSSVMLLLSSVLVGVIAFAKWQNGQSWVRHWAVMSVVFLGLALDEAVAFHEASIGPIQNVYEFSGFLTFAWVVPGAAFVVIFALSYVKFLRELRVNTRRLFLIAGSLFVAGALGMEMLQGAYTDRYGLDLGYGLLAVVEELLEMAGVVVFLYALISYMSSKVNHLRLTIASEPTRSKVLPASDRQPVPNRAADSSPVT